MRHLVPLALLALCPLAVHAAGQDPARRTTVEPHSLRCEYLPEPLAVEALAPRLSWELRVPDQNPPVLGGRGAAVPRGERQTAYRLLVASSPEKLAADEADLWDTRKVASDATQVEYRGVPVTSRMRCHWKVMTWNRDGRPSAWSAPATWSMGLLNKSDWSAAWISHRDTTPLHTSRTELHLPAPRTFRTEFRGKRDVMRATLYASALGIYEFELNGKRVGDGWFAPGWSDYRRRAYYQAYDVSGLVKSGTNALGAMLAEGWYSGYLGYGLLVGYGPNKVGRYFYGKTPALLAQLEIEYSDGTRQVVGTGPEWKVTDRGPIREADFLMGETHDARMELRQPDPSPSIGGQGAAPRSIGGQGGQSGQGALWSHPAYDASGWENAVPAAANGSLKAPYSDAAGAREVELGFEEPARLQAYSGPPIRATQELKPVGLTEPKPGVFVFDLGQNFAGVARLKVKGPAGTRVQLRFGEMVYSDRTPGREGMIMTENLRRARATDAYILRGDPAGETWQPRFTYHGFQYVEVTGYPGRPPMDAITGVVVHSDTPLTSTFESSDPVMTRFYQNAVWTQRANFVEVPTDCPQRDERFGWMGDAQIYARAATYHADVSAFFTKWLDDVEESQLPNGAYPDYAPYPMFHGRKEGYGTAWTDAGVIVPHAVYQAYGDTRVISRHWTSMRRFMEFRKQRSPELKGVNIGNDWGDWLSLGQATPIEYVDAAYFAYSARLMSEMATAIGKKDEADEYRKLFETVRSRFQQDYVKEDGSLAVETQTAYALALWVGLLPESLQRPAAARLAAMVKANGTRMATGFLGTRPLLPVLTANGQHELALSLFHSREFPSWGYEVVNGATSVWERWNSFTKDEGFHNPAMNSFSHYAFGAVTEWMFQSLAGIETDGPGFRKITLNPGPGTSQLGAAWVKASYRSLHGPIATEWKRTGSRFELTATVPVNTTATVHLPARDLASITESGRPLAKAREVKFVRMSGDRAIVEIGSGTYRFASEMAQ